MNFVSIDFLWFFLGFFTVYWLAPTSWRLALLLGGSYFFYAWWDWRFLALIGFATVVGHTCGRLIHASDSPRVRKRWLTVSIVVSLAVLGYFKYAGFFVDSAVATLNAMGFRIDPRILGIVLPVGISFFTFEVLTYTVDIYRRELQPTRSLAVFATFLAFFPHLVAGPIVRARELLGQLTTPRRFDPADLQAGLLRFTLGFFKKAVVADNLALQIVDPVFADPARYDTVTVLIAMLAYAAQIYADFSGYTDMALGCARVLGYTLPENFRYPYLARSISEFWSRWHMTMSRFFRDYVYISLGGNRRGPVRASGNALFTTMLSGLWHGASWTYVVWGALHGVGTIIGNLLEAVGLRRDRPWASPVARRLLATLAWCATFLWVVALWVVFRAHDFDDAIIMLRRATSWQGGERLSVDGLVVFGILAVASEHVFGAWREAQGAAAAAVPALLRGAFYAALVVLIVNLKPENPNPFIYFQF